MKNKTVRFLGITFTNAYHRRYFIQSTLGCTIMNIVAVSQNNKPLNDTVICGSGMIALFALIYGFNGYHDNERYSKHCIWWNGLICAISIAVRLLLIN